MNAKPKYTAKLRHVTKESVQRYMKTSENYETCVTLITDYGCETVPYGEFVQHLRDIGVKVQRRWHRDPFQYVFALFEWYPPYEHVVYRDNVI